MELETIPAEVLNLWRQLEAARCELGTLRRQNAELTEALLEVRDAVENLDQPTIGGRAIGILAPLAADWRQAA